MRHDVLEWWQSVPNEHRAFLRHEWIRALIDLSVKVEGGMLIWCKGYKFHRNDNSAVVGFNGTRNTGPAIIYSVGNRYWYENDMLLHRAHGPAIVRADGSRFWLKDGLLHRDDDCPAVMHANGIKEWWKNGKRHRDDGPAIIYANGAQEWWNNDQSLLFVQK